MEWTWEGDWGGTLHEAVVRSQGGELPLAQACLVASLAGNFFQQDVLQQVIVLQRQEGSGRVVVVQVLPVEGVILEEGDGVIMEGPYADQLLKLFLSVSGDKVVVLPELIPMVGGLQVIGRARVAASVRVLVGGVKPMFPGHSTKGALVAHRGSCPGPGGRPVDVLGLAWAGEQKGGERVSIAEAALGGVSKGVTAGPSNLAPV